MTQRRSDTFLATVVEGHHATVAQRQLYLSLALLARNLARYRAVYLVCEPVFAGHSLQLQHTAYILVDIFFSIGYIFIGALYGLIAHHGLGRVAKHLCHVKVEGLHAVGLHK